MAFYSKSPDMGGGIPGAARNPMANYPSNPANNARMGRAVGGGAGNPPPAPAPATPGWQYDPEQFVAYQPGGAMNPPPGVTPGAGAITGGGYQQPVANRGGQSFVANPTAPPPPDMPIRPLGRPGKTGGPPSVAPLSAMPIPRPQML